MKTKQYRHNESGLVVDAAEIHSSEISTNLAAAREVLLIDTVEEPEFSCVVTSYPPDTIDNTKYAFGRPSTGDFILPHNKDGSTSEFYPRSEFLTLFTLHAVEITPKEKDLNDLDFLGDRSFEGHKYSWAQEQMFKGLRVCRKGWNGKGIFGYYVPGGNYPAQVDAIKGIFQGDMIPYRPYYALKTAQNDVAVWVPTISDQLGVDWVLYHE